jgi:hypothetical protein
MQTGLGFEGALDVVLDVLVHVVEVPVLDIMLLDIEVEVELGIMLDEEVDNELVDITEVVLIEAKVVELIIVDVLVDGGGGGGGGMIVPVPFIDPT